MANTCCSLNIHCIFSTKERAPMLNPELRERLWFPKEHVARNAMWAKAVHRFVHDVELANFHRETPG